MVKATELLELKIFNGEVLQLESYPTDNFQHYFILLWTKYLSLTGIYMGNFSFKGTLQYVANRHKALRDPRKLSLHCTP